MAVGLVRPDWSRRPVWWLTTGALIAARVAQGVGAALLSPAALALLTTLIEPGEAFDYVSGCPLDTPSGAMSGSYRMVDEDGGTFDVDIPKFGLLAPVN